MSLNFGLISSEFNFNVASDSERVVYVFDDFRLDKTRRMLYRGAAEVSLPPKAVETLIALIEMRGEIVGKDDLMKTIWADTIVEESNLAHHLHVLRKTLGQKSDGQTFIETFRRRGYRFNADVSESRSGDTLRVNGHRTTTAPTDLPRHADSESSDDLRSDHRASPLPDPQRSRYWPLVAAAGTVAVLLASVTFLSFTWKGSPAAVRSGEISVTPLTNGNAVSDATISPDGRYFVYNELDGERERVWLQQTGQTGRKEITPTGERASHGKTFSPDGEFIYFVGQDKDEPVLALYRLATFGGPLTKIFDDVASTISFSPDGNEIAFVRYNAKTKESHLTVATADGGAERVVLTRSGSEGLSIGNTWSPDGRSIAFGAVDTKAGNSEGTCSIAAVDVQSKSVKELSDERWDNCFRMAWTPDGAGVVFIGTRTGESYTTRRDQIYYLSLAERRSRRLSTDGSRYQSTSLGITQDNSLLVVPTKRLSQIWVMNADGDMSSAVQLTDGQSDGRAGIAPLPDGRIGYISRVGEDLTIWIMDADGSNQRQISDRMPFVEELRATPDGRYFIFSARRDGFSHLYRMDTDGQNVRPLTDGESYEIDSTVSPDSRWVFYGADAFDGTNWKTTLRKTDIESGETIDLKELETVTLVPHISPDGERIAGATGGGIRIFSSSDGTRLGSIEAPKLTDLSTGAKWAPDGKSLTYLVFRQDNSNVWVHPIDSRDPRPLTDLAKGSIYFHAFSHDGTRLYVSRGYHIRDAVLIKGF